MPTHYKKKSGSTPRRQWRQESLEEAVAKLNSGEMGVNEAARAYGIPSRTLRRRRRQGVTPVLSLGPQGVLGIENEKRLVKHVQKLEKAGFAPDRETLRTLAFQFAEKLGINHRFNRETGMAGYDWLSLFLRRNKELSIRQSQGLSLARSQGMNREEAKQFFDLLHECYIENNIFVKPENVFNMDETGFQLNNEAGTVIATKGAKDVHTLTSSERGENITIIACCSAEGRFLPPVVIFKGQWEKKEFGDGLPSGAKVFMNQKSSYITAELFLKWLKEHFVPRKPPGKTILILDGHSSHTNSFEMLGYAEENDIILICLPSHTTQALQPLDRAFFKSFKYNLKREAQQWMKHHPGRQLKRLQAGQLIGKAWERSASVETALSGFRATGIFPLDPDVIPDHFYAIADVASSANVKTVTSSTVNDERQSPIPGPSREQNPKSQHSKHPTQINSASQIDQTKEKETPSKFLDEMSPVPVSQPPQRKRKKQTAQILNEKVIKHRANKKEHNSKNLEDIETSASSDNEPLAEVSNKKCKSALTNKKARKNKDKESESDKCMECLENYLDTTETVDWLRCMVCQKWYHETCSLYGNKCNICGREERRAEKAKKNLEDIL